LYIDLDQGEDIMDMSKKGIGVSLKLDWKHLKQKKILRNKIQCKVCGETIESMTTHDYKRCSCGSCGIDGGKDYLRRDFKKKDCYVELSEYEGENENG